jgi:hypothetical protein
MTDEPTFEFGAEYVATGRSLLLFELILAKEYADAKIEPLTPASKD